MLWYALTLASPYISASEETTAGLQPLLKWEPLMCLSPCLQALKEELAWARLTGKPRPAGFPPNTSCSRAALALDLIAPSDTFDLSGANTRKKHAVGAPNMAMHMTAAIAAGKRVKQLMNNEHNSLLRQLHRDNAWLSRQMKDSHAALEKLHDRLKSQQQAGSLVSWWLHLVMAACRDTWLCSCADLC